MRDMKLRLVALLAAAMIVPGLALAKDNVGGGGEGSCMACKVVTPPGTASCVVHGGKGSTLFGMTKCDVVPVFAPGGVFNTCVMSGRTCMTGIDVPIFPAYL